MLYDLYGGYHEWHVWRESLRDFAKLVFRETAEEEEDSFLYSEPAIAKEQMDKQTFAEHLLMFDPVYKGLIHEVDEKGRPAGRYQDEHSGVEIVDSKSGRAVFRYKAPGAKTVEIDIWGMGRFAMKQGEDNWWNCTVSGIEKGFHYYGCVVNLHPLFNHSI